MGDWLKSFIRTGKKVMDKSVERNHLSTDLDIMPNKVHEFERRFVKDKQIQISDRKLRKKADAARRRIQGYIKRAIEPAKLHRAKVDADVDALIKEYEESLGQSQPGRKKQSGRRSK